MKKWILLIGLLTYSSVGWSSQYETNLVSKFFCKVKSSHIHVVKDGIPKDYTGYENGPKVGDEVWITVQYHKPVRPVQSVIDVTVVYPPTGEGLHGFSIYRSTLDLHEFPDRPVTIFDSSRSQVGVIVQDEIRLSTFHGEWLDLYRYYKNDWSGMISRTRFYGEENQVEFYQNIKKKNKYEN